MKSQLDLLRSPWQYCNANGWQCVQLKRKFSIMLGKMLQTSTLSVEDIEVPYLKAQHVQWRSVTVTDLPTMWASPKEIKDLVVNKNDLLVCEGGEVGRSSIVSEQPPLNTIIQNALHLVRQQAEGSVKFLYYILRHAATQEWFDVLCNKSTIAHFTVEKFGEMWIYLPDIKTQHRIADYLDRETARIDALVAAKQRALNLLAEKRKAVIAEAVTRGLDQSVPLRESGVAWLGKIPAHWEIPPIYARFEVQLGKMLDEKKISHKFLFPYLRNIDVQWESINTTDLPEMDFNDEDRMHYGLKPNDILVCEGGEIGRCAVWIERKAECSYQKALHRLRTIKGLDNPHFFVLAMRTVVESGLFKLQATSATIQHLPAEKLRVIRYPAPPLAEQHAIVEHITRETAKLDLLVAATERSIVLLNERRAALISAAVTGQIAV